MKSILKDMKEHTLHILIVLLIVAITGAIVYLFYQKNQLRLLNLELQNELAKTHQEFSVVNAHYRNTIAELENELGITRDERDNLDEALKGEKQKVGDIEEQVEDLTGTLGKLDKLSKLDPELLQKYSKVFFLNEHYRPERLVLIDREYTYDESKDHYIHYEAVPFFEDMIEDALDDDINLWVVSSFRSFDEQAELKGKYTVSYGTGANTFSADQGYSEHQLGTTIDFTTNGIGGSVDGFGGTPAYEWLVRNAYKYGFVLSYPEDNGYYVFEPWHWRFVGKELARDLHDDDAHFYDLDQRDIDKYLINLFD